MYGVALYRDGERTVILYVHGGELYGACLLSDGGAQFEKWYFCDAEKLNKHIELALGKN